MQPRSDRREAEMAYWISICEPASAWRFLKWSWRWAMGQCFVSCDVFFFFQAEDGIRDWSVTGVQTCALPIYGAVGLSSGLNYYPCAWCDTDELVALAGVVRDARSRHVIELRYRGTGRASPDGGDRKSVG